MRFRANLYFLLDLASVWYRVAEISTIGIIILRERQFKAADWSDMFYVVLATRFLAYKFFSRE